MHRWWRPVRPVVLFGLSLLLAADAGARNHGTVRLRLFGPHHQPVAGATVEVMAPEALGRQRATSGPDGVALLPALPPGLYSMRVSKEGFLPIRERFRVVQDQTLDTEVDLDIAPVDATLEVTGKPRILDILTPSTTVAHHVTLDEVDRIPVGRDYRAYAQLAPGVTVVPNSSGIDTRYEPASKAGNFYHDRGASLGSRDNTWYLDGFNLTGMGSGTGDLTFNNEAILEESVITSGVPVEYGGGAGLVANLVTRSGGPELSGSVNYFFQKPSMYAGFDTEDSRLRTVKEDKYDTGFTLGGPVVRDRLWFFGAGQQRENTDPVELSSSASPVPRTETYRLLRRNGFAKLTVQPTASDSVVAQLFADPRETTGTRDVNTPTNRYGRRNDTPVTGHVSYQRLFGRYALLEARLYRFRERIDSDPLHPELGDPNTLLYPPGVTVPAYQRLLGSSGPGGSNTLRKLQADLSSTVFFTAGGSHQVTYGVEYDKWEEENGSGSAGDLVLTSLAPGLQATTLAEARDLGLLPASEYDTVLRVLREAPASAAFGFADRNGDGTLSDEEFAAVTLDSSTGNPGGGVNFLRRETLIAGVNNVVQYDRVAFVEDVWQTGLFTVTGGLRVEKRRYVASDGSTILTMDPRGTSLASASPTSSAGGAVSISPSTTASTPIRSGPRCCASPETCRGASSPSSSSSAGTGSATGSGARQSSPGTPASPPT